MNNIEDIESQILYKYRPYEGKSAIKNHGSRTLLNLEFFASAPRNFNDPFDLALPYLYTSDSFTLNNFIDRFIAEYPFDKRGKSLIDLKLEVNSIKILYF